MRKSSTDSVVKFFVSTIGLIVIFTVLKELQHIFVPFVIAALLYFVFAPLNNFLKKYKIPLTLSVLLDISIIALITWGISKIFINSFRSFESALPVYSEKLSSMIRNTFFALGITAEDIQNFDLMNLIKEINVGGIAGGFFSSTLSIVSTSFFVLLFFVFITGGYENIYEAIKEHYIEVNLKRSIKKLKKKLSQQAESKINEEKKKYEVIIEKTFKDITSQVQRYILTKTLISLLTAFLVGIVLYSFGVDFAIVWITLTFLFNFIPNIGSILAVMFPALVALVQFESAGYAILIAGILTGVQNLVGNLLEPKILGNRLGLNPLVILLSLLLWGYIWGIVGMFISVPLTAIIKIIISNSSSKDLQFISKIMGN